MSYAFVLLVEHRASATALPRSLNPCYRELSWAKNAMEGSRSDEAVRNKSRKWTRSRSSVINTSVVDSATDSQQPLDVHEDDVTDMCCDVDHRRRSDLWDSGVNVDVAWCPCSDGDSHYGGWDCGGSGGEGAGVLLDSGAGPGLVASGGADSVLDHSAGTASAAGDDLSLAGSGCWESAGSFNSEFENRTVADELVDPSSLCRDLSTLSGVLDLSVSSLSTDADLAAESGQVATLTPPRDPGGKKSAGHVSGPRWEADRSKGDSSGKTRGRNRGSGDVTSSRATRGCQETKASTGEETVTSARRRQRGEVGKGSVDDVRRLTSLRPPALRKTVAAKKVRLCRVLSLYVCML